jgi:hypothetical protein
MRNFENIKVLMDPSEEGYPSSMVPYGYYQNGQGREKKEFSKALIPLFAFSPKSLKESTPLQI